MGDKKQKLNFLEKKVRKVQRVFFEKHQKWNFLNFWNFLFFLDFKLYLIRKSKKFKKFKKFQKFKKFHFCFFSKKQAELFELFSPKSSIFFVTQKKLNFLIIFWDRNGNQPILFEFLIFKENNFLKYNQWQKDSKRCQSWHGTFKIFFLWVPTPKKCASYGMGFSKLFFCGCQPKKKQGASYGMSISKPYFLGGAHLKNRCQLWH